jgi:hypothetical protein
VSEKIEFLRLADDDDNFVIIRLDDISAVRKERCAPLREGDVAGYIAVYMRGIRGGVPLTFRHAQHAEITYDTIINALEGRLP